MRYWRTKRTKEEFLEILDNSVSQKDCKTFIENLKDLRHLLGYWNFVDHFRNNPDLLNREEIIQMMNMDYIFEEYSKIGELVEINEDKIRKAIADGLKPTHILTEFIIVHSKSRILDMLLKEAEEDYFNDLDMHRDVMLAVDQRRLGMIRVLVRYGADIEPFCDEKKKGEFARRLRELLD